MTAIGPVPEPNQLPESVLCAKRGIRTSTDFADLMSSLMTDLAMGKVTPQVGNAMCNAGSKLLKIVEMQQKYGSTAEDGTRKVLRLTSEKPAAA